MDVILREVCESDIFALLRLPNLYKTMFLMQILCVFVYECAGRQ